MKKLIILLLTLAMLLGTLAACKGKGKGDEEETTATPAETEYVPTFDDLASKDFNREFKIMTRDSASTVIWKPIDWDSNGEDPEDIISYAVFERNSMVEQKYNCLITQVEQPDPVGTALVAYNTGDTSYDLVVMPFIHQLTTMASSGYYRDFKTLANIDVNAPWWDTKTNKSLSIFDRYYTLCGDINIVDDLATWVILFNKIVYEDLQLGDHYKTVESGAWTWACMYENAAKVANPDSGMYGICTEYDAITAYIASAGAYTVVEEENSLVNNTRRSSFEGIVAEVYKRMNNDTLQVFGDNKQDQDYPAVDWGTLYNIFVNDQALYVTGTLSNLVSAQFADVNTGIGILPFPKYEEGQAQYISTVQGGNATGVSIMSHLSTEQAEDAALLVSAMAAASTTTLNPAFYERILEGRKVPDLESAGMMDIILNNRVVDLGVILSPQVQTILNQTAKTRTSYSFVNLRTQYRTALEEGLEKVTNAVLSDFASTVE